MKTTDDISFPGHSYVELINSVYYDQKNSQKIETHIR